MALTQEEYAKAKAALMQVVNAILETVKESGTQGAPLGPMYAACMATGISYQGFMSIVGALTDANQIKVSGHVAYYIGDLKV